MSELVSLFGKKLVLEKPRAEAVVVEFRPGGWAIVELQDSSLKKSRERVFYREEKGKFSFSYRGTLYSGDIQKRSSGGASQAAGADYDLTVQFPGKVRKILVSEGATVKQGDPLVLVEAMKMEFSIKAPADGKVRKLLVKEGQQLSPGDFFLEFDPK